MYNDCMHAFGFRIALFYMYNISDLSIVQPVNTKNYLKLQYNITCSNQNWNEQITISADNNIRPVTETRSFQT